MILFARMPSIESFAAASLICATGGIPWTGFVMKKTVD
jgi:hypothetical protein